MNERLLKLVETGLVKKAMEEMILRSLHKVKSTALLARFSQNEREFKKGYITTEIYRIEKTKITDSLIELLNEKEKKEDSSISFDLKLRKQKVKNIKDQIDREMKRLDAINKDLNKEIDQERKVNLNIRIEEKEDDINKLMKQLKDISTNI